MPFLEDQIISRTYICLISAEAEGGDGYTLNVARFTLHVTGCRLQVDKRIED